tara:strand:- start:1530 stop:2354 length:825 start_codon:yes stop_codon:yes gene_type:complete
MGWNIGETSETGLWTGGENIVRDNLVFYLDPGDYNCVSDGTGIDDEVTELALSDVGSITSDGNKISDLWTEEDGAPCFSFDGIDDIITFPTIDVSKFITGNSTTAGAITICFWFRTSHMDGTADGGILNIESYTFGVFISNGDIKMYASHDDGGGASTDEYTTTDVTAYNDDNWHFLVGMMNNTSGTIGDVAAGKTTMYIDDMTTKVGSSTIDSAFQFHNTDNDLTIGWKSGNDWYYSGEIGPVMIYSDYCLDEDERIMNYNYHRHRYYDTAIG